MNAMRRFSIQKHMFLSVELSRIAGEKEKGGDDWYGL